MKVRKNALIFRDRDRDVLYIVVADTGTNLNAVILEQGEQE